MLTIHHLRKSVSDRVIWLCEELGVPYELHSYDREPSMAAPAEYKALSAFGTSPVIQDGDLTLGEGRTKRRHDILNPELMGDQGVEVAFDHGHSIARADCRPGVFDPVEAGALVE